MLVLQHLPHLAFSPPELRMFPKALVRAARKALQGSSLPPGYTS
jgi:hypothetical protein